MITVYRRVGVCLFVSLFASCCAFGDVVIDNFNEGGIDTYVSQGLQYSSITNTGLNTTNTIGGERVGQISWEAGTDDTTLQVNQTGGNVGKASYGSQPDNNGYFALVYGQTANLNANFTSVGDAAFGIHFTFSDVIGTTTFLVETAGGGTSTLAQSNPLGGTMDQWVYFNFADFSGTADFSDIDKITVTVDGTSGADITIDDIESSAIPEPNTASLLLLIGLGLCGTIRRKLV